MGLTGIGPRSGHTLWELLKGKVAGPLELQLSNPLKLRLNASVRIAEIDFMDLSFYLKQILEYNEYNAEHSKDAVSFTDYDLTAKGKNGTVNVRLRLNPREDADKAAGLTHNVLLLTLHDDRAKDDEFHQVLLDTDGTHEFETFEDGECTGTFYRINDVTGCYKASVKLLREGSTAVTYAEMDQKDLEYWDFWREIENEAGQKVVEYLFIERNKKSGRCQLWRGFEIDPQRVEVS